MKIMKDKVDRLAMASLFTVETASAQSFVQVKIRSRITKRAKGLAGCFLHRVKSHGGERIMLFRNHPLIADGDHATTEVGVPYSAYIPSTSRGSEVNRSTSDLQMNRRENFLVVDFHRLRIALTASLLQISSLSAQSAWTQVSPSPPIPPPRYSHSAVYNPTSNRLIVFGGSDQNGFYKNDVWLMVNANGVGTPSWTQLFANGATGLPGARLQHTAVYDSATNRMIVFGGFAQNLTEYSDVWVLTNADGTGGTPTWIQLTPSGTTPARTNHGAIYDAASNRMIVFLGEPGTLLRIRRKMFGL